MNPNGNNNFMKASNKVGLSFNDDKNIKSKNKKIRHERILFFLIFSLY